MRSLGTALGALILTGCAMSSGYDKGPNGQPIYYIDGMTARAAYAKASKLCPDGYNIIGNPEKISSLDYVVTVECRPPATSDRQPAAPVPTASAPDSFRQPVQAANLAQGQLSFKVEQLAMDRGCTGVDGARPSARLIAITPEIESYEIACKNGLFMRVQCEYSDCRPE
jgi:hypothetical protein